MVDHTPRFGRAAGMSARDLAARLVAVREGAAPLDSVPEEMQPRTVSQAYAVADLVVAALEPSLGQVAGYKVGATSVEGQRILGLTEPFYGRAFERRIVIDGSEWSLEGKPASVEPEIGFLLAINLPPCAEPYSLAVVQAAIGLVVPLLEINRPAYARPFEVGGPCLIADNGVTQGFVRGGPGLRLNGNAALPLERVNMSRNAAPCGTGVGSAVLGDPINSLLWLANALRLQGRGLRSGDLIASGAMAPHVALIPGDFVVAEYSTLGRVSLRVI